MNYRYLIDANVLASGPTKQMLHTDFFLEKCIILEEIAHELQGTSLYDQVRALAVPIDGRVLPHLGAIVDEMVQLGIVKTDEGNGDAMLIAWGLMMREGLENQSLFAFMKENPVIVTNEIKVIQYAKTKGLDSVNGKAFIHLLDSVDKATPPTPLPIQ